jgi:hypothetical protein
VCGLLDKKQLSVHAINRSIDVLNNCHNIALVVRDSGNADLTLEERSKLSKLSLHTQRHCIEDYMSFFKFKKLLCYNGQ